MPAKKTDPTFEPVIEFNTMMAEAAESAFNMQMDSVQSFTKLGIDNVNTCLKVRTADDMMAYAESQKDFMQKASDMFVSDTKAMTDMGTKFYESLRSMFESNMKTTVAAATEAVKAA